VPAALDILLLAASMNSMVRHDDVGTSLKSSGHRICTPSASLARRLAAFRDHFFDVFHKVPDLVFLPPACRLRGASGARWHCPTRRIKKKEPGEYSGKPGTARGWPLATP
jgi:hypothetical protein